MHGLGGRAYKTWGKLPQMLFEGRGGPHVDVAVFEYVSGPRAILRRGTNVDECTSRLTERLLHLADTYEDIYLLGHSLGGLIIGSSLQRYLTHHALDHAPAVTSIAAAVLFGSPLAGSGWATPLLRPMFRELRWLKRFAENLDETATFFSTRVENHAVASAGSRRFLVPQFACFGERDSIVSQMSATLNVPLRQRLQLTGSHTSIAKPQECDHPQLD